MGNTIDMQDMRHLNLFNDITRVQTRFYFDYNDALVFCVPMSLVWKAVGENGKNVKKISMILKKKIKIIPMPRGIKDVKSFIEAIVSPVVFKNLEVAGDEIIITAGSQSKAALIGRNRRRLLEMQKIIKNFFGKNVRVV